MSAFAPLALFTLFMYCVISLISYRIIMRIKNLCFARRQVIKFKLNFLFQSFLLRYLMNLFLSYQFDKNLLFFVHLIFATIVTFDSPFFSLILQMYIKATSVNFSKISWINRFLDILLPKTSFLSPSHWSGPSWSWTVYLIILWMYVHLAR